ncbi:wax ester/triacylglycerol synthase domain-containing protein [Mycolicibacterium sp. F2034L]|uniref:wax ester/triacylglycerol synthase domain-containing protein n=1 Tax=Mycolicibacterium sp. F2034L TaxID=2926422 RepID=UPI001FF2C4FD|nr:wax ester/triacylglycerol synthase domain-containing protein [Mycolicibacterium sp. F2034L]MCK0175867.1 WS/DGAT domain-containing protein [Mycolicibacterium sp. F2034L]
MPTRLSAPHALALHTQTASTPAHSTSLVILEASAHLNHERLGRWAASALTRAARFRSRLAGKPFGAGQPVWADIADFDPAGRISQVTVPAPGGERELTALLTDLMVAEISAGTLWCAWTIDGLAGGRWAFAVALSPVLADGGAGITAMWERVLTGDLRTGHPGVREEATGPPPSRGGLVADTLAELVENQVAGVFMAADVLVRTLRDRCSGRKPTEGGSRAAPKAPRTQRRSTAFVSIPTADLRAVSLAFGGDEANVLSAACALSLQAWTQRHGGGGTETLAVAVPAGLVRLSVHPDDPVRVLTTMHTMTERLAMAIADDDETVHPAVDLTAAVALVPPRLARMAAVIYTRFGLARWGTPNCHANVSFLPGWPARMYCAGSAVVGMYTVAPLTAGCGVNISVTPRAEAMDLCVSACPDDSPEIDEIARGIADAVRVFVDAAGMSPRGEGQSVVTEMAAHSSRSSLRI